MAHTTATTTTPHSIHPTRKYRLRNSPPSRLYPRPTTKHLSTADSPLSRGVLLPLQPNLRRLPSRLALFTGGTMPPLDSAQVGSKRKRIASTNENAHAQGRSLRRIKRRRGYKERDSEQSDMDVDDNDAAWLPTDEDDEDSVVNRDHYHLSAAPAYQLARLRKEELVRLHTLVDTADTDVDTDHLTKHDLVNAIVAARQDAMPPRSSSPLTGPPSSPSSTGAGDDESDGEPSRPIRKLNGRSVGRSFSLNCLTSKKSTRFEQRPKVALTRCQTSKTDRSSSSASGSVVRSHSSSTTQSHRSSPTPALSPLVTRLRTRTVSFHIGDDAARPSAIKGRVRRQVDSDEDDDSVAVINVSPRRLRTRSGSKEAGDRRRVTPMRKAKGKVGSLKESDEEQDELEDDVEVEEGNDTEKDMGAEGDDDEEVDELQSSLSPSPAPARRKLRGSRTRPQKTSPFRNELRRANTAPNLSTPRADRGRLKRTRTQSYAAPSDGDDEETDGEGHGSESDEDMQAEEEGAEEEGPEEDDAEDDIEVEMEPRRLRNGKIVGEDEAAEECSAADDDEEDGEGEDEAASVDLEVASNASHSDTSGSDVSMEEELEEEGVEEDVDVDEDLLDATAKTLVRRRRDHLIKLCESRGIEAEGTKPQLVEALLQWRDHQSAYATSPSSGATARPPSTSRPGRRNGQHDAHAHTPVLLRSDRVQASDPDTPHPVPDAPVQQQADDGVLLDLEGLGLEDSVVPPSKLTKLEKIGSGGFKDVFIGKLGGKKVAIAEFRGQLTEMDIKELKLLARFDHPNVVKFLGVSIPENPKETPMIVSELCSNGDLFDYVRNVPAPHLNKVLSLMLDVARGLKYLHDHKPSVIHRDCKSSNILITSRVTAKIADFGLAKVKQSTRSMVRSLVGTVNWQAPELWHAHPKYNYKVDVFSCAMVFWEILQWHAKEKKFPWEGMNEHAIYEVVGAKQQRPSVAGLGKLWCPEIVELIEYMWAQDHKDRPDMTYIVEQLETLKEAYPPPRTQTKAR